jgi:hypothetical protein
LLLGDPREEFKYAFGIATEKAVRRDRRPFSIPIVAVQAMFDEIQYAVAVGNKGVRVNERG